MNETHGQSRTRLYSIWCGIKSRCRGTSTNLKKYYHDKNVSFCNEWELFSNFREWSILNGYKDDLTIDRIDNDLGYCPENCRWSTQKNQTYNRRKRNSKTTSEYKGVSWCANVNKWRAQGVVNRKWHHIGLFESEIDAAVAYDRWALVNHKQFACINFPEGQEVESC